MAEQELASIKSPNEAHNFTKAEFEHQILEVARCKRDIIYFAEKYFKIINLDVGLTTIKLYEKQKELLQFFVNEKRCIVLASRQSSKTTTYTIYALWLSIFHQEKKIMLLANKADTAIEIIDRIRLAYQYLPRLMKPGVLVWNKSELVFSNRSVIKGFPTASDAARGFSSNVVIMDEASFVPNNIASKVFESIYPVISSSKNSQFIMVSTPNGADPHNLYYETWCKANSREDGNNAEGWKPFRFDWWDVPSRDEQWKKNTIASIGEQRFSQEFGNEFLASSTITKLIPSDILEKHRIKTSELKALDRKLVEGKKQSIFSEKGDKLYEFTMWHEFNPKHTYLASGDCSEGTGGDASVLYVWDVTDLGNITQCAKFSSNAVAPTEFAFITSRLLKVYNNPYYICERNGIGSGYLDALTITYNYPNVVNEGKAGELGVFSHVTVKEKACIWSREMMTTQGFGWTFYDKELLSEFETFAKKDTKSARNVYTAIDPAHDDHVMAWMWCCWILNPEIVEKYFICVKTFVSQLEKIYPKLLEPQKEYTEDQLIAVSNDPLYKEFLEFKEEIKTKLGEAVYKERVEEKNDMFFKQAPKRDPFFGDFDDGPSWNGPSNDSGLNPMNRPKPFYIC